MNKSEKVFSNSHSVTANTSNVYRPPQFCFPMEFYEMHTKPEGLPKEQAEITQRVTLWKDGSRLIPKGLQLQKVSVPGVINLS